ncbi:MAG TPA: FtsQ-type POTRA domain-containing protein [Anaerolineaceae bacterium]|nr:FtsQ-type POTRA domain-containing protein [Anaerolineaceae bacterium]
MREARQPTSRAQQVRQRRQQNPTRAGSSRVSRTAERARRAAPANSPPVISRARSNTIHGVVAGTPLHERNRGNVRRQYYYTLSTPGAEVRLPAMPHVVFGWRLASLVLALALGAALYGLWNSPQFQISKPKMVGAQRISWDDVNNVIHVDGMPIVEADPREMETELKQAFPDLKSVSVSAALPARLTVTVKEREPLLAWTIGDKIQWIDKEGVAYAPRGVAGVDLVWVIAAGDPPRPTSAGVEIGAQDPAVTAGNQAGSAAASATEAKKNAAGPNYYISPELIQAILQMRAQVPDGNTLAYDPKYGLGWTDPKGWKVYFGSEVSNIDLKLKEYEAIVAQLEAREIKPSMISMEFLDAPFYRVEH